MTEDIIAQQRQLYGEPLGEIIRRVGSALGLSQAGVARVIGMSPAMLSQLASGHRTKIGNPLVLARFQQLAELAAGPVPAEPELRRRLDAIAAGSSPVTATRPRAVAGPDVVRRLLRAVASGRELEAAATAVADVAPGVAEVLRAYGTGSVEDAAAHYRSVAHLLE